ncbi:tyrosine protein phosphatase [Bacillus sp. Gen3]|nr:tyrosine protein phosphatase [Bacillus sp. Gen3]
MIDIHCHILPNMDDGPDYENEFMKMVTFAVNTGITHLFATPHHMNGKYLNPKHKILDRITIMNEKLQLTNTPIIILPGQELRIHRGLLTKSSFNEILTLGNNGKYLLLELPSFEVPIYTWEILYELSLQDIIPIIVHPERNVEIINQPNLLYRIVQEGGLIQLTSGSIIGHFGNKIKSFTEKIIEHDLAHFIASDAHNLNTRSFSLHQAYDKITKLYGMNKTFYFKENAELLRLNLNIKLATPIPFRKKILGIF